MVYEKFDAGVYAGQASARSMQESLREMQSTARDTGSTMEHMFGTMERASDNAMRGMIYGTRTWQQALSRAFADVLYGFTRDLIHRRVFDWARSEITMTQATAAGNAARKASGGVALGEGLAGHAQFALSRIFNDAQQVFSGVFAFLSPLMGPAAAGPAGAASASVSALAGNILFAESGAWNVGKDTFAYLHAGEMVVPRSFAASLRDAGGMMQGGGDSYSIHVHAIDTRSGAEFIRDHAPAIAEAVSGQMRQYNRHLTRGLKG